MAVHRGAAARRRCMRAPPRRSRPRSTTSGGARRSTLSPAVTAIRPSATQAACTSVLRDDAFQAEQQAHAAHARRTLRDTRATSSSSAGAQAPAACARRVEEARREDDVQHRVAGGQASGLPPKVVPWVPAVMPPSPRFSSPARRRAGSRRRCPWPSDMTSGVDAGPFMGEQLAGAAHAGLHLVEAEDDADTRRTVARRSRRNCGSAGRHAALALDRLDDDAGGLGPDRVAHRVHVVERHVVEARPPAGRSPSGIARCRWRRASPACGRGTRPRSR